MMELLFGIGSLVLTGIILFVAVIAMITIRDLREELSVLRGQVSETNRMIKDWYDDDADDVEGMEELYMPPAPSRLAQLVEQHTDTLHKHRPESMYRSRQDYDVSMDFDDNCAGGYNRHACGYIVSCQEASG